MSEKYKFYNPDDMYFITPTVIGWVDIFTKSRYCELILNSLRFCQHNKGLVIHAWVIMSNHLHLIVSKSSDLVLQDILRDFKRFTSIEIIKLINESSDSRKTWMLEIFSNAAANLKRVKDYKVWQDGNHPIALCTTEEMDQRLDYLHDNPVRAEIVNNQEDYIYSSAIDYTGGKGLLNIDLLE
ncbi:MAG TPA: transposase [Bacteroidales bacterium]|jgi:REP element-mobilizing transposase RayT|nr:transposase [Bacteroidales bacterium]|tara:strand:- start:468 stop:1016 length:549 start_codon:yes stop_codon:yes gene_type:complete